MSSSVVVVGSFNVDHVWRCESLPAPGATIAGRYSTGPGGKGFNQAVAARPGAGGQGSHRAGPPPPCRRPDHVPVRPRR